MFSNIKSFCGSIASRNRKGDTKPQILVDSDPHQSQQLTPSGVWIRLVKAEPCVQRTADEPRTMQQQMKQ